jgi:zinc protease
MRGKLLISVCMLALGAGLLPASAQTSQAASPQAKSPAAQTTTAPATTAVPLPTVDEILKEYAQASGGQAAFDKLTSRVSTGTFEMDQMAGEAKQEIYAKAPNKVLYVTDSPSFGVVQRGFNGTMGWQDTPQTGLADLTGDQLATLKREADFYAPLHMKALFPKMTVKAKENVNGHDAYIVEAIPVEGHPVTLSFDAASGLLVRAQTVAEGPMGTANIDTTLGDYRDVDGVKLPFLIHSDMGQFAFTIKLTDVKHNVPIDDSKFNKPAAPPAAQ